MRFRESGSVGRRCTSWLVIVSLCWLVWRMIRTVKVLFLMIIFVSWHESVYYPATCIDRFDFSHWSYAWHIVLNSAPITLRLRSTSFCVGNFIVASSFITSHASSNRDGSCVNVSVVELNVPRYYTRYDLPSRNIIVTCLWSTRAAPRVSKDNPVVS